MSDVKKVELKKIQEKDSKERYSPSIRVDVTLSEPTEDSSPVFNWPSLIKKEKHRFKKEHKYKTLNGGIKNFNGDVNVDDDDDNDDDVKQLARHFERKYGGNSSSRKKKKPMFFNYSDFALGYDESDSFIDNSEAFDEEMPDEVETYYGGYYVNIGPLEFKKVISAKKEQEIVANSDRDEDDNDYDDDNDDDDEDNNNDNDVEDEEDQDDEEEQQEDEEIVVSKKRSFVNVDESDEEIENNGSDRDIENGVHDDDDDDLNDDDNDENDNEEVENNAVKEEDVNNDNYDLNDVKLKEEFHQPAGEDSAEVDVKIEPKKEFVFTNSFDDDLAVNYEVVKPKKSKKRHYTDETVQTAVSKHKKKSIRVKPLIELLEQKESNDASESTSAVNTEGDNSQEQRETLKVISNKRSVNSSQHKSSNIKHVKLPDNLPSDVLDVIDEIKTAASRHNVADMGSRSFFNAYINGLLLNLEIKVRSYSTRTRHKLYHHLSLTVPCSKETLMKRSKKLVIIEEEKRMAESFKKLKVGIETLIPGLIEKYTEDYQRAMEQKSFNDLNDKKSRIPQKKFPLNDEMKGHIRDLVTCKLRCFYISKSRGESPEDYIAKFLSTKLKPLWPQGWMRSSTLLRESHINTLLCKLKKGGTLSTSTTGDRHKSTVPNIINENSNISSVNISPKLTDKPCHNSSVELPSSQLNVNIHPSSISTLVSSSLASTSISSKYSSSNGEEQQLYESGSNSNSITPVIPYEHDLNVSTKSSVLMPNVNPPVTTSSIDLFSRLVSTGVSNFGFDHNHTYSASVTTSSEMPSASFDQKISLACTNPSKSSKRHSTSSICIENVQPAHVSSKRQSVSPIQATNVNITLPRNQSVSPVHHHSQHSFSSANPHSSNISSVSSSSSSSSSSSGSSCSRRQSVSPISSLSPPKPSISPIYSNHHTLPAMVLQSSHASGIERKGSISPKGGNDVFKIDSLIINSVGKTKPKDSCSSVSNVYHRSLPATISNAVPKYKKQLSKNNSTNRPSTSVIPSSNCEEVLDLSSSKTGNTELMDNSPAGADQNNISVGRNIVDYNYGGIKADNKLILDGKVEPSHPQSFVQPKESGSSKPHLSRKQRLLQETLASAISQSSRDVPESVASSCNVEAKYNENERYLKDETATATDILCRIINDTLQDNTTPLQPQFTNCFNFENRHSKNEKNTEKYEQTSSLADEQFNKKLKYKKDKTKKEDFVTPRSSSYSVVKDSAAAAAAAAVVTAANATTCTIGGRTTSRDDSNNPMNDAAEIMKDLMALNQFGRSAKMTIPNFMDSSPISVVPKSCSRDNYDNKYKYPTGNTGAGTTMVNPDINRLANISASSSYPSQSSLRLSSNVDVNAGIPRMDISGFQNEFFKHVFKADRNKDDVYTNQLKKYQPEHGYNKRERHHAEGSSKTARSVHHHSDSVSSIKNMPENSLLYPHQRNVITPPINRPPPWPNTDSNV